MTPNRSKFALCYSELYILANRDLILVYLFQFASDLHDNDAAGPRYKAFLFDDSPKKNQFFLDDVIDFEKEYYFLVEINEPLKKRNRFAAIRKQKQENEVRS